MKGSLGVIAVTAALLLAPVNPVQATGMVLANDPGPAGSFQWKGFNWQKRFWGGAPQYNKAFDPANVSNPDANGFISMGVSNATGAAPAGAEFQSTREGFGYGTYSTTVEKDVSGLQKEVVWGCLFTYDPDAAPGYTEIDLCEASAWGGGASYGQSWPVTQGHGYWFDATKPPGSGNNTTVFAVTGSVVLTHRMIWAPGKLTFETYAGEGYAGALLKRTVLEGTTVPVPARERIHFNLWVTGGGGGNPAHVKPEKVVIRDFSFTAASSSSAASAAITKAPETPAVLPTPVPLISGSAQVGRTIVASPGPTATDTSLSYQWYRSGTPLSGAVSSTYALLPADLAKSMTVRVTSSRAGSAPVSGVSASTASVRPGILTAPAPLITGTPRVGHTLTARPGIWPAGAVLKYQWYRSGVPVSGSSQASYRPTGSDTGKLMGVRVMGTRTGYAPLVKSSGPTAAVAAGALVAPVPTVSGVLRLGYLLTANTRAWTLGTTLRYQWYRSAAAIPGATGKTYRLTTPDRGDPIRVRVTGSQSGYTPTMRYSASTPRIR